jgi:hypothetical protein
MNIALQRLKSQHLLEPARMPVAGLVASMGAMQAQDYGMCKWAAGVRLADVTEHEVTKSLDAGEIIRTHVLRPTWHIVAAADLRWLLALTGPHVRSSMASRHRDLEITPALETKSRKIIEREIGKKGSRTREEIGAALERGGIVLGESRLPHLLMLAELDALICSGPVKGARPSYALVDDRVPAGRAIERDAALAELAMRYFAGHGPATLRDFVWWSGLPVRDARRAVAALPREFVPCDVEGEMCWYREGAARPPAKDHVVLLPAYDEFLIAYAERSASLPPSIAKGVVSSNGIFRSIAAVNGTVVALWTRAVTKAAVKIEVTPLNGTKTLSKPALAAAMERYAAFIGKPLAAAR